MAAGGEQVYATLLLSDSYLPGALVLAHSLRDARTTKKLAVLVTLDYVSADSITQLQAVYDYVLPVPRIRNAYPSNLYLMNRSDLHSAFTKINLWKQAQFSKIVYVDADVIAYRAPDELFSIPHAFAAAPDIGWPDLFNTGVMVLTPNLGDYYAMMAMAERGISFDGADQGLLNMHFKNSYHRISFTYNVTPSAHYQYVPAYRHFQSSINMVHFIGANKPWFAGRNAPHGTSSFDEMVGRWWAVYDRHYRVQEVAHAPQETPSGTAFVQYFTKGEFQPQAASPISTTTEGFHHQHHHHHHDDEATGHHVDSAQISGTDGFDSRPHIAPHVDVEVSSGTHAEAPSEQHAIAPPAPQAPSPEYKEHKAEPTPMPMSSWDASRQPPPPDSKPEAINFPSTHYAMSQDFAPFVPPPRYPSPPRNLWYEVPKEPPTQLGRAPEPVFPWEGHQPRPSRTFAGASEPTHAIGSLAEPQGEPQAADQPHASTEPSVTTPVSMGANTEPSTPSTPTVKVHPPPSEPWTSFQLNNAWDEVPEIGRYVEGLQRHRRGKSQGSTADIPSPLGVGSPRSGRKPGLKLTDFPSETERPSLPVTPAPIARPSFWGHDEAEAAAFESREALPAAEGVPAQSEWDPEVQLQKLARQQYEHLLRKLGGGDSGKAGDASGHVIPKRPLPFGSENVTSPTYVSAVAPPNVARPRAVKPEASATGTGVRQTAPLSTSASATKGGPQESSSEGRAAKDDSSGPLLESPLPRTGGAGTGP